jgi:hypothetical protein
MERLDRDVCANCGKTYDQHLLWDGNKCEPQSINGWFPKRLADAFTKSMRVPPASPVSEPESEHGK